MSRSGWRAGAVAGSGAEAEAVGASGDGLLLGVGERSGHRLVEQPPLELDARPGGLVDLGEQVVVERMQAPGDLNRVAAVVADLGDRELEVIRPCGCGDAP